MTSVRASLTETERSSHEIAAAWLLRKEAGLSAADDAQLALWLEADRTHGEAWENVQFVVTTLSDNAADANLMAMRGLALAARGEPVWRLGRLAAVAVLAIAVAAVGASLWIVRPAVAPRPGSFVVAAGRGAPVDANAATYRTAVGERSVITLSDGSVATLDTNSVLQVAFTPSERGVRLLRGQALFEVAKHKATPFQVYAGDRRITAVGTKFDVRLGTGPRPSVSVALLEGVVQVATLPLPAHDGAPTGAVTMAAGEVLVADAAAPIHIAAADTSRVASWRAGVLTFDDAPLAQAVAEMNRYTTRPILLADPKLSGLRVSGVFKTGDPDDFAAAIGEVFPVRVSHDAIGRAVLEPKG